MKIYKFRQSWLNDVIKCPEQARAKRYDQNIPDVQSDSMSLGTAVHAGIEEACKQKREGGIDIDACCEVVAATLDGFLAEGGWTETYSKNTKKVYEGAEQAFLVWESDIAQHVGTGDTEVSFEKLFHKDKDKEIWLTGTADFVQHDGVLWDWKTSGREYQKWEAQRWNIQPTVYSWAFDSDTFKYGIMIRDTWNSQIVEVKRSKGHHDFLLDKCLALCDLIEADLPSWPHNDAGWWCSPKWCPVWDRCKGAYIDGETWT